VQDTCIKIYQSIDKFNRNSSFAAWVFRIAHNSCYDSMRNKTRKRSLKVVAFDPQATQDAEHGSENSNMVVAQVADAHPGPQDLLDGNEQTSLISEKLSMLPDTQRIVLVLHDIEGFSYLDIAEIVGEPIGTVRSRLHYGRLKMRELLEPYYSSDTVARSSG
jgi:RNA polymerase sigma-70 factor (ECF subfamily)